MTDIPEIKKGQIWQRSNLLKVAIGGKRTLKGSTEFQLLPLSKDGRVSWKSERAIQQNLTFIGDALPTKETN